MNIKYVLFVLLCLYGIGVVIFFINILIIKGKVYITKYSENQKISIELLGIKRICICLFMSLIWPYLVIKNLFSRGY